jgi:hypothetical protein
MDKLIGVGFCVVVAVVIWALSPPTNTSSAAQAIVSTAFTSTGASSTASTPGAIPGDTTVPERRLAKRRIGKDKQADGTVLTVIKKISLNSGEGSKANCDVKAPPQQPETPYPDYDDDPHARVPKDAKKNPWPVATEGEFAVKGWVDPDKGPQEYYETPMDEDIYPSVAKQSFKESVRKFYGRLPEDGKLPDTVYAMDVLPQALLTRLQLPSQTKLTMLGPHYTNDVRSYQVAMSVPDARTTVFGISYVTPDGQSQRKYIQLRAATATP